MSSMANWQKLYALSWPERCSLFQALVLIPTLASAVRLVGLRRTYAVLMRLAPRPAGQGTLPLPGEARIRQLARMVSAAARHGPYRGNCLSRSLALWWMLRREGIASDLRLGVRKATVGIDAHAWVERDGQPLNDRMAISRDYSPFSGGTLFGGTSAA
jgi:hypothetical protein